MFSTMKNNVTNFFGSVLQRVSYGDGSFTDEFELEAGDGLNDEQANARVIIVMYYFNKSKNACSIKEAAGVAAKSLEAAGLLKNSENLTILTDNLIRQYQKKNHTGDLEYYKIPWPIIGMNLPYLRGRELVRFSASEKSKMRFVIGNDFIREVIAGVTKCIKSESKPESKTESKTESKSDTSHPEQRTVTSSSANASDLSKETAKQEGQARRPGQF